MYKASITHKKIVQGKLIVEVNFAGDNGDSFSDSFETTHEQNGFWIGEQIIRRLKDLNSLTGLTESINVGEFIEPIVDLEREEYKMKAQQYMAYMSIARNGFVNHDRPIIQELRIWLRENFKDNYLDLF